MPVSTRADANPNEEGAPPWRELCVVCNNPVYLAQRLRVQGQLYHRTCFRCARCSAQLTLVDYYETVDGQFCCETCPDEVTIGQTLPQPAENPVAQEVVVTRSPPTPELSATTRHSIVAMRRMFFDTDDAKLNRYETLQTDLPPADIPMSPNEEVMPSTVHSPLGDKTGGSPIQSSLGPNPGVEYHTSPSPSRCNLDDRTTYSSLQLDEVKEESKSRFDDCETTHDAPLAKSHSNVIPTRSNNDDSMTQGSDRPSVTDEKDPQEIASSSVKPYFEAEKVPTELGASGGQASEPENSVILTTDDQLLDESITSNFGESEEQQTSSIVEAVNEFVTPPRPPKRRQKSPRPPPKESKSSIPPEEYPEALNPFEDEDEPEEPSVAGTNPFGSDSDEEFDVAHSTPVTTPQRAAKLTPTTSPRSDRISSDLSPVQRAHSLNPFEDSDEEEDVPVPVPLPRKSAPSPEPMPFPRSALRASQRSIASTLSTSSRKKRPAPPPPIQTTPSSPTLTIKSTRSRKTRRAPLPPGMASSRLSLASDSISLADSTYASTDVPVQISAVVDRISEWVEHTQLETSYDTIPSTNDSQPQMDDSFSDVTQSSPKKVPEPSRPHQSVPVPSVVLSDVSESDPIICLADAATDTIAPPSSSPVKTKSPRDSLIDNKSNSLLRNSIQDEKELHERFLVEENMKNSQDKRKSLPEHSDDKFLKKTTPPLPLEPTISILQGSTNTVGYTDSDVEDRLSTNKKNKDDANMTRKISGEWSSSSGSNYSLHKSAHGQWRRKSKAPAPPLPLNADRVVKKDLPLLKIKQELNDIEIKQQGLERQGVALEARIRDKFDSGASITPYVEELVLQLFELVNEKNELFRKQAELMYMRRQQHLEEEQVSLEKEIRDLMSQPEANKTDSDKEMEEQLILRLIEVVERRDAIVQCLEMDRIREAEEDRSITARLNIFTKAMAPEDKSATSPKKKSHSDGGKKKWYTLNRSKKSHV